MFTSDPRAPKFREAGVKLLRCVMEGGPNNGEWDPQAKVFRTPPTEGEMIDETLAAITGYGIWASKSSVLRLRHGWCQQLVPETFVLSNRL